MLATAAAQLGYHTHVLAPDQESVAAQSASTMTRADYHNRIVLADFADACDVVTYEFENIAVEPVEWLADRVPVHPSPRALRVAQERIGEKRFVESVGGRPAKWAAVDSLASLREGLARVGTPAVLKTARFGYDGKGQVKIDAPEGAQDAWDAIGGPAVLEAFVPFEHEFSILIARGLDGSIVRYAPPLNLHRDAILRHSTVPAPAAVLAQADEAGRLPSGSQPSSTMSACWRPNSSSARTARCSTRWRRGCIIRGTGRSRAPNARSSRTISARSAVCRSARRR